MTFSRYTENRGSNSVRRYFYDEFEGRYAEILYDYILRGEVFVENDGVLREKQIRPRGPRADMLTKCGDIFIAIEVKVWPHLFSDAFEQALEFVNKVDCSFVAVPAEYVSVAKEEKKRGGTKYYPIGILPISLATPPRPADKAVKDRTDTSTKNFLKKQFEIPYWGYLSGDTGKFEQRFFNSILDNLLEACKKRAKKISGNVLAMIALYGLSTVYSPIKFIEEYKLRKIVREIASNANMVVSKWGFPGGLYELGILQLHQLGSRIRYYRLNPRFTVFLTRKEESTKKLNNFLSNEGLTTIYYNFTQKQRDEVNRIRNDKNLDYMESL